MPSNWTQSGTDLYYNDGNVGIGTSAPNNLLVVTANDDTDPVALKVQNTKGAGSAGAKLILGNSNSVANDGVGSEIMSDRTDANTSGDSDLVLSTSAGTTMTERMRVRSGGQVDVTGSLSVNGSSAISEIGSYGAELLETADAAAARASLGVDATSVKHFGAVGDGMFGSGGTLASGDNTFTCSYGIFTASDVGKLIRITLGTRGARFVSHIASVNSSTSVELVDMPTESISNTVFCFGTDDSDAIDAAFQWINDGTPFLYNDNTMESPIRNGNSNALRWPGGYYMYNGAGFAPDNSGGRHITLLGDGPSNTFIEITSDSYLISCPQDWTVAFNFLWAVGITTVGGKGFFMNHGYYINKEDYSEWDAAHVAAPQAGFRLEACRILGFSECAFGSYWVGTAMVSLNYCWIETDLPNTRGIFFPIGMANPDLTGTIVIGCTYKLVLTPPQGGNQFIQNLAALYNITYDDHEADIWIMAQDPVNGGIGYGGGGLHINNFRLGGENLGDKPRILIADYDDQGGTIPPHLARHDANPTDFVMPDIYIDHVTGGGNGTADNGAGPLVRSYTSYIGAMHIRDNSIGSLSYLLELMTPPTALGYSCDAVFGPNHYSQGPGSERPIPCNYPIGIWLDTIEETPSPNTPGTGSGGYDLNYLLLSATSSGDPYDEAELITVGNVMRAPATDGLGGTNAREYTFTTADTSDYVNLPIGTMPLPEGPGLLYIEFDLQQGSTRPLSEIDVVIKCYMSGGNKVIRRGLMPAKMPLKHRIPVPYTKDLTGLTVIFYPSPDVFEAGVNDKVIIGRPHVYRANRPVNSEHLFIAFSSWKGGHIVAKGPEAGQEAHLWPDWTNKVWRMKFVSAPTSETNGTSLT